MLRADADGALLILANNGAPSIARQGALWGTSAERCSGLPTGLQTQIERACLIRVKRRKVTFVTNESINHLAPEAGAAVTLPARNRSDLCACPLRGGGGCDQHDSRIRHREHGGKITVAADCDDRGQRDGRFHRVGTLGRNEHAALFPEPLRGGGVDGSA